MIYRRLVDLIKREPERLALRWGDHIRESEVTKSYRRLSKDELLARHTRVFQALARWLEQSLDRSEFHRFFEEIGRERYLERFPLCEVNYAMIVAKRGFSDLVQSQGLLDSPLEFYQAMEFLSSIDQFFDLGNFYISRGYLDALESRLEKAGCLPEAEIRNLVFRGDPNVHPDEVVGQSKQHR